MLDFLSQNGVGIDQFHPALIVKVLIIIGLIVYSLFAFVLVRQVSITRNTVETPLGPRLSLLAISHFTASILLIVAAFVVL